MKKLFIAFALFALTFMVWAESPPQSYVLRVAAAAKQAGAEHETMRDSVSRAAAKLTGGGKLWAAGNPSFIGEMCGRAGGLMLIQPLGANTPAAGDVVLYGLAGAPPVADAIVKSGALVAAFGDRAEGSPVEIFDAHAETHEISPTLGSIVSAWIYTGDLIDRCAQLGKMPVTYETIGLPGGYPRIQQYQAKGIFWIDHSPNGSGDPPDRPSLGAEFAAKVVAILDRIENEDREKLDRAGEWTARALKDGKTVHMYCMGHFVPDEIAKGAIGAKFKTATWNSGFTQFQPPDDTFSAGDIAIHIGYQHPPNGLYERVRPAGANMVYVDLLEHRDWKTDPHVIWIDPMWPWDDAVVTLKGYDIPMLPPSGIVNTAIAYELYRLATK